MGRRATTSDLDSWCKEAVLRSLLPTERPGVRSGNGAVLRRRYGVFCDGLQQGSMQCCGVTANDMPLVCGLDVTCPAQDDQYRQCPATGGAATVANPSSAAELGEQPLP